MAKKYKGLSEDTKLQILYRAITNAKISNGKLVVSRFNGESESLGSLTEPPVVIAYQSTSSLLPYGQFAWDPGYFTKDDGSMGGVFPTFRLSSLTQIMPNSAMDPSIQIGMPRGGRLKVPASIIDQWGGVPENPYYSVTYPKLKVTDILTRKTANLRVSTPAIPFPEIADGTEGVPFGFYEIRWNQLSWSGAGYDTPAGWMSLVDGKVVMPSTYGSELLLHVELELSFDILYE